MQVGELSNIFKGYAPSAVNLFLFIGYTVEILILTKVWTSFKLLKRAVAPAFPMLTETSESYLRGNLCKTVLNLITPASPSGLLSRTIVDTTE